MTEPLLTIADLMTELRVSRRTVYNIDWMWQRVVYVGGLPRWHRSDLRLYLATRPTGRRRREPRTRAA